MDAEHVLFAISRAFRGSAFADRVLLALAKTAAKRNLTENDRAALCAAVEF
mgnify:CR=1 FL=1